MSIDEFSRSVIRVATSCALLCTVASASHADLAPGTLIVTENGGVLAIDPLTGNRETISGFGVGTGPSFSSRPLDVGREESGDLVVADLDADAILRIDIETGDRTIVVTSPVGGAQFRPTAVEVEFDGSILAFNGTDTAVERIDPVTGNRTVLSSPTVGTGIDFGSIHDMLRVGVGSFVSPLDADLLLSDSVNDAILLVSTATGNRTVLSSGTVGTGPVFETPRSIARVFTPTQEALYYVVDSDVDAIFRVDGATGDREIVASNTLGSGPAFDEPYGIWPSLDGRLYVADTGLWALLRVDPATGDRTIVSDPSTGTGPFDGLPWAIHAVPTPTQVTSFETEAPGTLPVVSMMPDFSGGSASVESAASFSGNATALDGNQVLYLTTGPGDRGEPTFEDVTGNGFPEFDVSFLILPVVRGQNSPRRLRFAVDYLTAEDGSIGDPTDVIVLPTSLPSQFWLLSMNAANGAFYTPLTSFDGTPVTGPDRSSFDEGRSGYQIYEVELDVNGGLLFFRVRDEQDGARDTGMLIDDVRFVPEPGSLLGLAAGSLLLIGLRRLVGLRRLRAHL